ncbi:MAG TPA: hypothetical protein VGE72_07620 [Azospirillum sp.]
MITERMIRVWAGERDAEGELPLLVRRLIGRVATVTAITMPGGDAVSSPGWDGDVMADQGNAWVPEGRSCWEMGRNADPSGKANDDYAKRTLETPAEVRRVASFVFVTPRRWNNKEEWRQRAEAQGAWRAVRVYDARDLEHWLEETPAVALWFADRRGIAGPGVEAPDAAWRRWTEQTTPAITEAAFLAGREEFAENVAERLRSGKGTVTLAGDSREEVVAFVAAVVRGDEALRTPTVVVTGPNGWRFVEANPDITIAIAATEEAARTAVPKSGRMLVVPRAAGGILTAPERQETERLPRPERRVMQDALAGLGLDPADADRWARHCGRSWAVWRRLNAMNPAIRHPHWLDRREAGVLSTIILVGAWNTANETDRAIVAEISGRDYAAVEADLLALAQVDDPPVLRIGHAWKAKAPLELLHLWGGRLTTDSIDRFLACLRRVLETPDPALDLEDDKRWAAAVYGKARGESGALIQSMLDSLVKLAVRGVEVDALKPLCLDARVSRQVEGVLNDADRIRWLSVSSFLSELAEAAPDAFLRAVGNGLRRNDNPISAIVAETAATGSGITGRCWHADLLWALERLAWAPQRLARVADILARLARAPKPGNWSNTPLRSLKSLFRSWWPQVTVPLDTRLAELDRVVRDHPDVGWELLVALSQPWQDCASANATPVWRDDDTGAIGQISQGELITTLRHVYARMIESAPGNASRVGKLMGQIRELHPDDEERVWVLTVGFAADHHSDEERDLLCEMLRHLLHRHLNYDELPADEVEPFLARAQDLYRSLQPRDVVIRHRWLFASRWLELPEPDSKDWSSMRLSELRRDALSEVLAIGGWADVARLVQSCGEPGIVGATVAALDLPDDEIVAWANGCLPLCPGDRRMWLVMADLLRTLGDDRRRSVADRLLSLSRHRDDADNVVIALLQALPFDRETWLRADDLGETIARRYWETTSEGWCHDQSETAAERLLAVGRPCAALGVLKFRAKNAPAPLLIRILSDILCTTEPLEVVQGLDQYVIRDALERLAADSSVDDEIIIRLEFGFSPLFRPDNGGDRRIHRKLARDPGFFVELLTLAYRSENADRQAEPGDPNLAQRASGILHKWRRVPGTAEDGTVDPSAFTDWVRQALEVSTQQGRGRVAQSVIGQALAHAPADSEGLWPCVAVRDVLDDPDHDVMRRGLHTGLFNKRGMTSRMPDEGGGQERVLAARYRGWADALASTHWRLAGVLRDLADYYERDGRSEDADAAWRGEE